MAQGSEFPLRKPPGFHWDIFLLGITTFIAGLLGIPAPNGLIPQACSFHLAVKSGLLTSCCQAPIHTQSLVVLGRRRREEHVPETEKQKGSLDEQPVAVVEQRVSNLVQGSLCLVLMTGPFLHLLHFIPRGRCFKLTYLDVV